MSREPGRVLGFLKELRRRKVLRVAVVYAVVAWLLIQIAETTFEPLQLPAWSLTLFVMLAALGFPLALVLAWAFEMTPAGIQRDEGLAPVGVTAGPGSIRSIAVLPFADMSPERDQGYFCEGVAEEILNSLAKMRALSVASRTSSFRFRDEARDIRHIGRALQVGAVLEGSVRKADSSLRVTAQLIDVDTGFHLWSERFDRELEDVFAIQDEIASSVAEALQLTISPDEQCCMDRELRSTENLEAYEHYLRGWSYFHRFGQRNIEYAIQMFRRATEIDPEFSRAWAGLADACAFLFMYGCADEQHRRTAEEASCRAVTLCPDLAENHASRGLAHMLKSEWSEAEAAFERAIELDPTLFEAPYFYARACVHQGKPEQAAALFQRAGELRPDDYQTHMLAAQNLHALGRFDDERRALQQGMEIVRRQLDFHPDDVRALYLGAVTLAKLGQRDDALVWAERALAADPLDASVQYNLGCMYAVLGETDQALSCLERADLPGMANRAWVDNDPDLESLRDEPRFRAIVAKLR